mgnify:CR=1 FL=1
MDANHSRVPAKPGDQSLYEQENDWDILGETKRKEILKQYKCRDLKTFCL